MTVMLEAPVATTTTVPAPRQSEDDVLLDWVANMGSGVRGAALALSDMPTTLEERKAAIGWVSVRGVGILPDRRAALIIARWVRQGMERWGGEMNAWKYNFKHRMTSRRGDMTAPLYRKLCKPVGGARRDRAGFSEGYTFWSLNPTQEKANRALQRVSLYLIDPRSGLEVVSQEHMDDLENLVASIEGLKLHQTGHAWRLTLHGCPLTFSDFQNLDSYL